MLQASEKKRLFQKAHKVPDDAEQSLMALEVSTPKMSQLKNDNEPSKNGTL